MSNRILLIGGNFSPELTGIGKYNGEMIDWLAQNEFDCTVITTFPYYPQWKIQEPYRKNSYWYKKETIGSANPITIIRCPHYVPGNPSGAKRLISDLSIVFSTTLALFPLLFKKKIRPCNNRGATVYVRHTKHLVQKNQRLSIYLSHPGSAG